MSDKAYFHTKIDLIDIFGLNITEEFAEKNIECEGFINEGLSVGVDGNNQGDPLSIMIASSYLEGDGITFDIGDKEARALADAIYKILDTRKI